MRGSIGVMSYDKCDWYYKELAIYLEMKINIIFSTHDFLCRVIEFSTYSADSQYILGILKLKNTYFICL